MKLGPVLAQSEQNGYVLRIHLGAEEKDPSPEPLERVGTMTITDPYGRTVHVGYWMDWPEDSWPPLIRRQYYSMPIERRAELEAVEQLTHNLEDNFNHHIRFKPTIESIVHFLVGG